MNTIEELRKYGSPLSVISECLRSFIRAPDGCELLVCDYANIEGRILAWLAGEDWKVKAFRDFDAGIGEDIYILSAKRMHMTDRTIGKVAELALGYQGGVRAFQQMASIYNVKINDKLADQIKIAWREAHPNVTKFWYSLEDAAIAAVLKPDKIQSVVTKNATIKFRVAGNILWCCLPSKRVLAYPYPRIERVETPWGAMKDALTYWGEDSYTHQWDKLKAYGGLLCENVTQALARDILAEALVRLEANNYATIMHVHDEIICEMEVNTGSVARMKLIMTEIPPWAKGLPLAAEGYKAKRYRK